MDEEMTVDQTNSLDALSSVLTKLTENPYDVATHAEHVRVAQETGLEDQVEQALEMYTGFWAAGDYVWIPLLEKKLKDANLESPDGLLDVLALFDQAEVDYLSIPVLKKHVKFLIERYDHFVETGSKPDTDSDLFSTEWTRHAIADVVAKGIGHLTESQELWNAQQEWEQEVLQQASAEEKAALVPQLEELYLTRLKQPHDNYESTFQAYSSFTTNYKPPDVYEKLLVQASKTRANSVKSWNRREPMELGLKQAGYSLEGYNYYITSELKLKKPELFILATLFERAIAEADKRRWKGESGAEESLRAFWIKYLDVLRQNDEDDEQLAKIFRRATRSVPGCGDFWARYLRFLERTQDIPSSIENAFTSALAFPPILKDVEALVQVTLSRASYEKRRFDNEGGDDVLETLFQLLIEGITRVRQASPAGDPRLRLEKFFSALCHEQEALQEQVIQLWQSAAKHYKTSYLAWSEYADALVKHQQYDAARATYKDVAFKNIDWPEALWEAWLSFEHLHGSVEEVEECLDRIERARNQVNARLAKEAEKAAYAAMQLEAKQQASALISETIAGSTNQAPEAAPSMSMDVDFRAGSPSGNLKRKAEDETEVSVLDNKKARTEDPKPVQLKRDRENSTVFVADLPTDTKEEDLSTLFKDCGPLREVKITKLPNFLVATVEFMDKESVPAALTKDKKRVHGQEVTVHLAWKSTLYVTNFPEKADDTFIRELFGKYGVIFDVRWPSKKFKSTRRFCYVQFTSPHSAEAARELHGTEVGAGHPMSVLISDPGRRKDRTDSDANDRELYVAGLAKSVTKDDLMKIFTTYGSVKDIRLALDDQRKTKGFAFVEFEQAADAVSALAANNFELKKRRMAVTIADSRRSKPGTQIADAEVKNRSVRIKNLPAGTQEGLLQQVLEKRAHIKRVEVFTDSNEATVELENPAEAGKLLLHPDPLIFNGSTLQLSEESAPTVAPAAAQLFVPRAAASRPRAGLGSKRGRGGTAISASAPSFTSTSSSRSSGAAASSKGQDDFRKMLGGA
ncbi:hypothetical protein QCA50_006986 [Cerrena zonata]|uniref:U4/U6 snRNA-associated-splicing factor PRP24 n=1 Tax=Cerrena zonata TaxID=2478898 RepID=A0AAW0GF75_9APHY